MAHCNWLWNGFSIRDIAIISAKNSYSLFFRIIQKNYSLHVREVSPRPLLSLETERERARERERERCRDDNVRTALANPRRTYCADSVSRGCSLRRAENFAVRGCSLSRSFVARAPSGIASHLNSRIRKREREARRPNHRSAHLFFFSFSIALIGFEQAYTLSTHLCLLTRSGVLGSISPVPLDDGDPPRS